MPKGKGTYGSKVGRPKKKRKGGKKKKSMGGLTAAQKKLPKALQAAILKRKKNKKYWLYVEEDKQLRRSLCLPIPSYMLGSRHKPNESLKYTHQRMLMVG